MDFSRFQLLTFDCYGTLIDWESGMLGALRSLLAAHGKPLDDGAILALYSELEPAIQQESYRPYRQVLEEVVRALGRRLGFAPSEAECRSLPDSLRNWLPFPDTVAALRALQGRFRLGVISNIDDDLFAMTARHLEVPLDLLVTAQQAGSYKPSTNNFKLALGRMGLPAEKVLHCAESLYHDVAPARSLGLATVWVNRHAGKTRPSATRKADIRPDLEVPDLKTLAALALGESR
ncbi:MAG TPA: haloacid dehalogenase type II [Terriglobales bacterium]|jgi:2-haloacid dehalogenase|nr:haloacid dehalogenase type II [Terriglobales bacterium]